VAAGVAVPLGVMLLGALGFLAYREWNRKKLVEELVAQKTRSIDGGGAATGVRYEGETDSLHEFPLELGTGGWKERAELSSMRGPYHEVGVSPR